ncbi:Lrp/AsnC family transcriptional regulator [Amaricoccus macauensis]|uniref:Lrp/AsnC family transcriptional regulator n=1 Tax=Amaricoccus macauensis TaxID=57001 RepID=A0A840SI86_9RHOB|nr:Lrp/AsnC family transcriptional regulator [Amaricoccus macauensis]MBB5222739.1 Lrp/AsnC family transcriptional regulator [Amaricoccus macauensis]
MNRPKIDHVDAAILRALQRDSSLSQRALAEEVGLSQNACWRRLQAIRDRGLIVGHSLRVDRAMLALDIVAFVVLRTRRHSREWLETFRQHVSSIPEVVDFYRISGEYDYMLKVVTHDIASYDRFYQRLIEKVELETVTTYFAMEAIVEQRPFPITETGD